MRAEINKHMLKFSILSHSIISYNPFTTTTVAVVVAVAVAIITAGTNFTFYPQSNQFL